MSLAFQFLALHQLRGQSQQQQSKVKKRPFTLSVPQLPSAASVLTTGAVSPHLQSGWEAESRQQCSHEVRAAPGHLAATNYLRSIIIHF